MIQRIQTIFLLLAVLAIIATMCLPMAMLYDEGVLVGRVSFLGISTRLVQSDVCTSCFVVLQILSYVALGIAAAIDIIGIFLFKKRPVQMTMCRISNVLIVISCLLMGYNLYSCGQVISPTAYAALPIVAIVLNIMARVAINKDEKLVRSADRLR